nr:phage-related minor tail protein [uncultured Mediterranean phage uvMED]
MASETQFKIKAIVEGLDSVKKLKSTIREISGSAKQSGAAIGELRTKALNLTKTAGNTTNTLKTQVSVFTNLRDNVSITSNSYKILTQDIANAKAQLASLNATASKGGGFMAGARAAAPTALSAAGASFLPPAAQFGAFAGFQKAGLKGAAGGAAIGLGVTAAVGAAGQVKASAEYAASISRLEIALKAVTKTSADFSKAQKIIKKASTELNIPIDVATKQFTQLSASVLGSGYDIGVAETAFRGVSEAIKATGGNADDVKSGIRAMSQIFGKGKLSAEELSGQLGERLAGAVVKFAKANDMTLEALQKNLRDGTVGLDKVVTFTEKLRDEHKQGALDMAASQEEAGQRMDVALKNLSRSFGEFFKPVGAGFQIFAANAVNELTKVLDKMQQIFGVGLDNEIFKLQQQEQRQLEKMTKMIAEGRDAEGGRTGMVFQRKQLKNTQDALQILIQKRSELNKSEKKGTDNLNDQNEAYKALMGGAKSYYDSIKTLSESISDAVNGAFKKMEDTLVNFVMTGKLAFRDLASSILESMARIAIQQTIMKPFTGWFEGLFSAKGNVLQDGKQVTKYAKGGTIIHKPHYKMMANGGIAVAGEAGSEAILPLKRGRGGRLGVETSGNGGTVVNVSVNADGTSVEGEYDRSRQLGQAIAAAVQQQLVMEQRPGGLLYG